MLTDRFYQSLSLSHMLILSSSLLDTHTQTHSHTDTVASKTQVSVYKQWLCLSRSDQGRLLDYIVSWGNLTEEKVAFYLRDILEALHYLHNCRIAHLDLKVSTNTGQG